MKLSEYLELRGGNNLTNAEASAIGIVMRPGWPEKYRDQPVPPHLEEAVRKSRGMAWGQRRKFLKKASALTDVDGNEFTLSATIKKIDTAKSILEDALSLGQHDPLTAMLQVENALDVLESIK
jgi:hypothetical protein